MTNKIFSKTVGKATLLSIVMAAVAVLSAILTAIFGVSYAATLDDANTLTVTVNQLFYADRMEDVDSVCNAEFDKQGLTVKYHQNALDGADGTITYFFAAGDEVESKVATAKANLNDAFAAKQEGEWSNVVFIYSVSSAKETSLAKLPTSYAIRAAIAAVVFALLAFAYATLRFGAVSGIVTGVSTLCGAILSAAVVLLTRMPITNSSLSVFAVSSVLAAAFSVWTMHKFAANKTEKTTEETAVNATAVKEIGAVSVVFGAALVLVGAVATQSTRWLACEAFVALIVTAFIGLFFTPALYLQCKQAAEKRALNNAQYGKQRAEKQERKAAKKSSEEQVVEDDED